MMHLFKLFFVVFVFVVQLVSCLPHGEVDSVPLSIEKYHTNAELIGFLKEIHRTYPDITKLYKIGESVRGQGIWAIIISHYPNRRSTLKPIFKYEANIHGNEPVGRELLLHLIKYLVEAYQYDETIEQLLKTTEIHIAPCLNPDGFAVAEEGDCQGVKGRTNANGFDLNRNFPDFFADNPTETQPEAGAMKRWTRRFPFVLAATFHGGSLVASYPFDNSDDGSDKVSLSPEDDVMKHLALTYSLNHNKMSEAHPCPGSTYSFRHGITNGAAWYALKGGWQDYQYLKGQTMDITIEASCCKYPKASELAQHWELNLKSLLVFMDEIHRGVKGIVVDAVSKKPIKNTEVEIQSRVVSFKTTDRGEYWRLLREGTYFVTATASGYKKKAIMFEVKRGKATIVDIELEPIMSDEDEDDVDIVIDGETVKDDVKGNDITRRSHRFDDEFY